MPFALPAFMGVIFAGSGALAPILVADEPIHDAERKDRCRQREQPLFNGCGM
jgi:hypothetical protein